tara:strand:- start:247 stop:684 length:438 start_codon:yes stop_codon:yes gene_type:complete
MFYNLRLISFGLFQFLFFIVTNFSLSSFFIGYGIYHVLPWTANIQNEFKNSISEKLHLFSTYVPENYLNFKKLLHTDYTKSDLDQTDESEEVHDSAELSNSVETLSTNTPYNLRQRNSVNIQHENKDNYDDDHDGVDVDNTKIRI